MNTEINREPLGQAEVRPSLFQVLRCLMIARKLPQPQEHMETEINRELMGQAEVCPFLFQVLRCLIDREKAPPTP